MNVSYQLILFMEQTKLHTQRHKNCCWGFNLTSPAYCCIIRSSQSSLLVTEEKHASFQLFGKTKEFYWKSQWLEICAKEKLTFLLRDIHHLEKNNCRWQNCYTVAYQSFLKYSSLSSHHKGLDWNSNPFCPVD